MIEAYSDGIHAQRVAIAYVDWLPVGVIGRCLGRVEAAIKEAEATESISAAGDDQIARYVGMCGHTESPTGHATTVRATTVGVRPPGALSLHSFLIVVHSHHLKS